MKVVLTILSVAAALALVGPNYVRSSASFKASPGGSRQYHIPSEASIFDNYDYVGRGYNIYKGNPHASVVDPGFEAQVFQIGSNEEGEMTSDMRFIVPDGIHANSQLSCSNNFLTSTVMGAQSLVNSLAAAIDADFTMLGTPFSANAEFNEVSKKAVEDSVFMESSASCELYLAALQTYDPPPMTKNFMNAVKNLPATYTTETTSAYTDFLRSFGTHVATEVTMGARFVKRREINSIAYSELLGMDINLEARASIASTHPLAAIGFGLNDSSSDDFLDKMSIVNTFNTGSRPVADGDVDSWLRQSFDDPAPLRVTLQPICNFVSWQNQTLYAEVKRALVDFCNHEDGADCNKPLPDTKRRGLCPKAKFEESGWLQTSDCTVDSFSTTNRLSCGDGSALTAFRLARHPFMFANTHYQFVSIGCAPMTKLQELNHSSRWTAPQIKSNGTIAKCRENEFITGMNLHHNCLFSQPEDEFVSLQCRRSRVDLGGCIYTPFVLGAQQQPSWTAFECPTGYLMNGIQYIHQGGSNLESQAISLRCCRSASKCIPQKPCAGHSSRRGKHN